MSLHLSGQTRLAIREEQTLPFMSDIRGLPDAFVRISQQTSERYRPPPSPLPVTQPLRLPSFSRPAHKKKSSKLLFFKMVPKMPILVF